MKINNKPKKNMRSIILIALIISNIYSGYSQEKPSIAILPFQFSSGINTADAEAISQKVESAFINSKRFTVIERANFSQIFSELEAQKNEIYLNSDNLAKQGELIGATQIVVGNISSAGINGTTFNIKIIDVSTGQTLGSKSISDFSKRRTAGTLGSLASAMSNNSSVKALANQSSTSNALGGALLNIDKEVQDFIKNTFAVTYSLAEITKLKGEAAEEILVIGGQQEGLKTALILEVILETTKNYNGKVFKQKSIIGKVKVDKVEGDLTTCRVTSGGDKISKMFNPENKIYLSTQVK
jgi:TolB-like protein